MTIQEIPRLRGTTAPSAAGDGRPTVSVVIPCYNYSRYLKLCVESVLNQDGVNVEVLIIDDASTDDSADVARALARRDGRIEARQHLNNHGHIATYNEGLGWARGAYTVLISADDMLVPGALRRAARVFARHPDVGLVYGRAVAFFDGEDAPAAGNTRHAGCQVWGGRQWIETRCRLGWVGISSPEVVVRTDLQRRVGGYRPDLPHSADFEMWLRLATHSRVAHIDADQAYYRRHRANMSLAYNSRLVDLAHRKAAFDAAAEYWSGFFDDTLDLHRRAMRGMAADVLWSACRAYDRGSQASSSEELIAFAAGVYPGAAALGNHRRLSVRRRLGPRRARLFAPFFTPDVLRHRVRARRLIYGRLWWRHAL